MRIGLQRSGMMTLEAQFRSRVNAFLECTRLSPTKFGMKALGDPNLMRQIDRGRSPSLRTADRVLAFISEHDGESHGARDPPRRQRRRRRRATRRSRTMIENPMEQRTNPPAEGRFPRPVSLGARAAGWVEAEVDGWIRERIAESRFEGGQAGACGEAEAETFGARQQAAEGGPVRWSRARSQRPGTSLPAAS